MYAFHKCDNFIWNYFNFRNIQSFFVVLLENSPNNTYVSFFLHGFPRFFIGFTKKSYKKPYLELMFRFFQMIIDVPEVPRIEKGWKPLIYVIMTRISFLIKSIFKYSFSPHKILRQKKVEMSFRLVFQKIWRDEILQFLSGLLWVEKNVSRLTEVEKNRM